MTKPISQEKLAKHFKRVAKNVSSNINMNDKSVSGRIINSRLLGEEATALHFLAALKSGLLDIYIDEGADEQR